MKINQSCSNIKGHLSLHSLRNTNSSSWVVKTFKTALSLDFTLCKRDMCVSSTACRRTELMKTASKERKWWVGSGLNGEENGFDQAEDVEPWEWRSDCVAWRRGGVAWLEVRVTGRTRWSELEPRLALVADCSPVDNDGAVRWDQVLHHGGQQTLEKVHLEQLESWWGECQRGGEFPLVHFHFYIIDIIHL